MIIGYISLFPFIFHPISCRYFLFNEISGFAAFLLQKSNLRQNTIRPILMRKTRGMGLLRENLVRKNANKGTEAAARA